MPGESAAALLEEIADAAVERLEFSGVSEAFAVFRIQKDGSGRRGHLCVGIVTDGKLDVRFDAGSLGVAAGGLDSFGIDVGGEDAGRKFGAFFGGEARDVRPLYHPGWCGTGLVASTASELCHFFDALFAGAIVGATHLSQMLALVRVPGSMVEIAIALSIAYVGADNLLYPKARAKWPEAFLFGLIHGLGFASFLGDSLLAESSKLWALLAFNLGVEIGQVGVVLVAGQGGVGYETIEDVPDLDLIIVPIGGGGLISGIAQIVKLIKPDVTVIGVEMAQAPAMKRSIDAGHRVTLEEIPIVIDGLAVKTVGEYNFEICKAFVDDIVTVDEQKIFDAVPWIMERCKLVAEGAAAATVAALLTEAVRPEPGSNVACVLSGGNLNLAALQGMTWN